METEIKNEGVMKYTDTFKKELDRRYAAYKNGAEKLITEAESRRRLQKLLEATRK